MITATNVRPLTYWGLSTDTKPTGITGGNGQKFIEIDTHAEFYYDEAGDQWCGVPTPDTTPDSDTTPDTDDT